LPCGDATILSAATVLPVGAHLFNDGAELLRTVVFVACGDLGIHRPERWPA